MLTMRRLSRIRVTMRENCSKRINSTPEGRIPADNTTENVAEYVLTPTQRYNQEMRKRDVLFAKAFVAFTGCIMGMGYYYLNYIWIDPEADEEYTIE